MNAIAKLQLSRRQVAIYALFVTSTAAFLFLYASTDNGIVRQFPYFINHTNVSITLEEEVWPQAGFLVYSEQCQIPDVDPYDPTIRHMIERQNQLNCSDTFPPLTYTIDNIIIIDHSMLKRFKNLTNEGSLQCCYSNLVRTGDGKTDNGVSVEKNCTIFSNGTTIDKEFIEVSCSYGTKNFYKNYHSFIHDKPWVEKRCENIISNNDASSEIPHYSIMIIGADSVSRLNMHRQFEETVKYLKNNMDAVEMYGYNKVGDNTFPNLIPLLTGYHVTELPSVCRKNDKIPMDDCPLMWKRYMDIGYRTFYAEDTPYLSTFNYLKPGFYKQPTDYYNRPFMLKAEKNIAWKKKMNCHLCLGSVSETESILSWLEKFAKNFHNRSYFAMAWINSLTHDYLNYGSYGDHFYYNFLKSLHTTGKLNNTILIFMSDHGMRWGEIRNTYIGRLEERLPALLISFPPSFHRLYPRSVAAVRRNSHRLTTPFDLYATLENLMEFNGSPSLVDKWSVPEKLVANFTDRARSLFSEIDSNRSCSDASIAEHWCTCQQSKEISLHDAEVRHIAKHLVDSVNSIIKPRRRVCSKLRLNKIVGARLREPTNHLKGDKEFDMFDYTVVLSTKPGGAAFEGTVRFVPQKHTHTLLGTISRLNVYGNQSSCVDDAVLRKYCYCKRFIK